MGYDDRVEFKNLLDKTLVSIKGKVGDEELIFICSDGSKYKMHHYQDCCECVSLEDICGDLQDLIGAPILKAEESTSETNPVGVTPEYQDSFTWTFYRIATRKGLVVLRWYGESNGYYSESVDFELMNS